MKKFLLGSIVGIVLCSGVVYGVNLYKSEDVLYESIDESWEVNNVNEAINSLYNMKMELDNLKSIGTAEASDIASGETAVVQGELITGTAQSVSNFTATVYVTQLNSADNGTRYPVIISNPGYKYAKFVFYDLYQRMNVYFDGSLYYTFSAYDTNAGSKTLNNVNISGVKKIKFEPVYVSQVNRVRCDVTLYN